MFFLWSLLMVPRWIIFLCLLLGTKVHLPGNHVESQAREGAVQCSPLSAALSQIAVRTDGACPSGSEIPGGCVWLLVCRQAGKDRQGHFLQGMVVVKAFIMGLWDPYHQASHLISFPKCSFLDPRSVWRSALVFAEVARAVIISLVAHKKPDLRMIDGPRVLLKVVFSLLLF